LSGLSGCGSCPKPVTPAPVVVLGKLPECHLPTLPGSFKPFPDYPDPDGVFLSRADFVSIVTYVMGMRDWIKAAQPCLARSSGSNE
jgi:hypothetical protein